MTAEISEELYQELKKLSEDYKIPVITNTQQYKPGDFTVWLFKDKADFEITRDVKVSVLKERK